MRSTISLADRIRGLAAERHLTQEDLGAILDLTRPAVRRRLRGQTDFTATDLQKLAKGFDMQIGALFGDSEPALIGAPNQTAETGTPLPRLGAISRRRSGAELGSSAPLDQAGFTGDGA